MKRAATQIAAALVKSGFLDLLERFDRRPDRLRVLTYHRVDDSESEPDLDPGLLSATPEEFRQQLALLRQHFTVVDIAQVCAAMDGGSSLPPRAVLITFDDAYEDFARVAWPLLREFELPCVLFVPTAFPGNDRGGFWWDRLYAQLRRYGGSELDLPGLGQLRLDDLSSRRRAHKAIRSFVKNQPHDAAMAWLDEHIETLGALPSLHRVLDWAALREMSEDGLAVCPHGHSHALSTRLSSDDLMADLGQAQQLISRELPAAWHRVMAYPANDWDAQVAECVRKVGYSYAFAGGRRVAEVPAKQPRAIQRIPVLRHQTALFRAQLHPLIASAASLAGDIRSRRGRDLGELSANATHRG